MRAKALTKKIYRKKQKGGNPHVPFTDIGEGYSKSIYIEPTVKDTAVLIPFYNPANFKRILKNVLYIMKIMKEKHIPCFVGECVFNDAPQQIPDATIVLRSNSYMFYKEQIINRLEKLVQEHFTKLVILDGDILFDAPNWLDKISKTLDTHNIIQPFSKCCWLTPDNKLIQTCKHGYAYAIYNNIEINANNLNKYNPGFTWAMTRSIFRKLGGLYENAIIGGGDFFFTLNFFKNGIPDYWFKTVTKKNSHVVHMIADMWKKYYENFKKVNPTIGYTDMKVLHLFHGTQQNRQYSSRYDTYTRNFPKKWEEAIVFNKDGLTEFRDPSLRSSLLPYFTSRNEDITIEDVNAQKSKSHTRKH
jgi:hypothetical protein